MTIVRVILFLTTCIFCASMPATGESRKTLKLGAVLSLTGMGSVHGLAIREGIEFAKEDLISKGWNVTVTYEDDATIAKNTLSGLEKVAHEGVKFFIGPTWGILAKPAAPFFERHKLLSLQPCNSSDFVSGANEQNFFFFSPPSTSKTAMTDFLKQYPPTRVAVITNNTEWGQLWNRLFSESAMEAGHEVVFNSALQFSEFAGALPTLVTKFRSQKITILLDTTSKENLAEMVRRFEQQKFPITVLSPDLIDAAAEKLVHAESKLVNGFTITPIQKGTFTQRFEGRYKRPPLKYSDSAYDAVTTLAAAIEAVGDDTEAVKEYFLNHTDRKGESGHIRFNKSRDVAGAGYTVFRCITRLP